MSDPASTKDLDDTDEWIMKLRTTPLRSIEDIRLDREPEWVEPVLALGMQREYPQPPELYRGPRWWRLSSWLLWNFGDLFTPQETYGTKQEHGRHHLVRGVPETAVYRPTTGPEGGQGTPPPQERLPMSRTARALSRWRSPRPHQARARHS